MRNVFLKACALSVALIGVSITNMALAEANGLNQENFPLEAFAGAYAVNNGSLGGVGINGLIPSVPPNQVGSSVTSIGQLVLNKDGIGTLNYFSLAVYAGPNGTPLQVTSVTNVPATITVDPILGVGTLTVPGLTVDLVAMKSGNKVQQIFGHGLADSNGRSVTTYTLTRQFE